MPRRSGGTTPVGVERVVEPTRITPSSGAMKPAIRRRSVVFPQPLGPSRVTNSWSPISRLRSLTAVTPPKRFVTCSMPIPAIRRSGGRRPAILTGGSARHWATPARSLRAIAVPRPRRVASTMAAVMMSMVTIASAATGPSAPVS